jgi:hypothetical protein
MTKEPFVLEVIVGGLESAVPIGVIRITLVGVTRALVTVVFDDEIVTTSDAANATPDEVLA